MLAGYLSYFGYLSWGRLPAMWYVRLGKLIRQQMLLWHLEVQKNSPWDQQVVQQKSEHQVLAEPHTATGMPPIDSSAHLVLLW